MTDYPRNDDQAEVEISEPPEIDPDNHVRDGKTVDEQWEETRAMTGEAPTG